MRVNPILLSLLLIGLLPATAWAGPNQVALFQDDALLVGGGAERRAATLAELEALGVDTIKVQLGWADVAGAAVRRPAGFDGRDPADYPGWERFDALVAEAEARGFELMLALSGPAPGWATRERGDDAGIDRPSAREFGKFAEAAGVRYPSVGLWSIWNEPNHAGYLFPQTTRSRVPSAPALYRALVTASVAGLRRSGHDQDQILFGELLPIGKERLFRRNNMRPLLFLREFFCLDARWQPYRGSSARLHGCRSYRKLSGVTGFAHHPYTRAAGPRGPEPSRDDATIRSLRRVTRALDIARAKGRIGGGRLRVWITEFGFQSNPPDPFQARLARIPAFLSESEWIAYRNPRVASYSQYTLVDAALRDSGDRFGSWQSGLRFADGRVKRGVYAAYRLPLFVRLLGPDAIEVWGAARPGGRGARVQVEQRGASGGWSELGAPLRVRNARGYFRARFELAGAATRTYRHRSGGHLSWTAKAVVR